MRLAEVEELCDLTVTAAAQLMHCLANIQPARPPAAAATGTGAVSQPAPTPTRGSLFSRGQRAAPSAASPPAPSAPPGALSPLLPPAVMTQVLDSLAQLFRQGGLPAATHSHIFYALARLTKPYTSSRGVGVGVGAKAGGQAGQGERPRGVRGAAVGVESALQRLLPLGLDASRLALPEYSAVDLVTVFSGLAALRVPLSSAWLDAWWEYSRLQLSSCPLPLLCACLRAVRAVEVAVPSLWSQALWDTLAELSHTLKLAEVEHLMSSLVASQLRPPWPPAAAPAGPGPGAAAAGSGRTGQPAAQRHTPHTGPHHLPACRHQRQGVRAAAPRQAPLPGAAVRGAAARAGDGSLAAAEPRPAASSQVPDQVPGGGDRAVLLLAEALKHAAHGFDFRP
ncbi:hypothetical protein QJQ45_030493 [Haematococcus lacustris]|nr:hypothetical protein QJQ45_030493 [Haematococcus lacustris]